MTLPANLIKYCDEKIKLFKDKKMWDAPMCEIIGVITDYELIFTNENCGGYFDKWNSVIAINTECHNSFILASMFHEMSHAFNAELEKYEKEERLISWKLKDEMQVDATSKYLLDNLFPGVVPDQDILGYQWCKEDAQFLSNWYGEWVENDFPLI